MKPIKGCLSHRSRIWQVCLFLLSMLLFTLLALGLWGLIFGSRQDTLSLKVMQMLQTVGTFMLPCFVVAFLGSERPMHYLHLAQRIDWKSGLFVVLLMLLASPDINLLAWLNEQMQLPDFLSQLEALMQQQEENAAALTEQFIQADSVGVLLFNLLLMALLPAFSEELCFRGVILQFFTPLADEANSSKANLHLAIWGSAIIFSAIHFQFYGFIPRMLMGALFGYLLVWSGSLWLPILAHFTNNALAVLLYNVSDRFGVATETMDAFGSGDTLWAGLLSLVLLGVGIYGLRRYLMTISRQK